MQKLVPKARVVVGHGQMGERELEKVMLQFIRDEADVLVSTTIIENGLDIPRANTIMINRADRMGLSELYQLARARGAIESARLCLSAGSAGRIADAAGADGDWRRSGIQRSGRGLSHRGAGSGIARRGKSAGA